MMPAEVTLARRRSRRALTSPALAGVLSVALLMGGLPMLSGLVLAPDSKPAFTLDICQPIGGVTHTFSSSEAPLIPALPIAYTLQESGVADEFVIQLSSRLGEAPNPPPPEHRA
jgi:hypothetical protein